MSHDEEEEVGGDFKHGDAEAEESLDLPEEMMLDDDDDTDPENRFH